MPHGISLHNPDWGYDKPLPPLFGNDVSRIHKAVMVEPLHTVSRFDVQDAMGWLMLTVPLCSTPELNEKVDAVRGRKRSYDAAFYEFDFTFWRGKNGRYWPDNVIRATVTDDILAPDNGRIYEMHLHRREQFMVMRKLIADIEARQKIHIDSLFAEEESA